MGRDLGVASRFRCAPPLTSPTRRQDRLCARERVPVNRYGSRWCSAWVRRLWVFLWGLVAGSLTMVGWARRPAVVVCGVGTGEPCGDWAGLGGRRLVSVA